MDTVNELIEAIMADIDMTLDEPNKHTEVLENWDEFCRVLRIKIEEDKQTVIDAEAAEAVEGAD